jgi:hypothetical protein
LIFAVSVKWGPGISSRFLPAGKRITAGAFRLAFFLEARGPHLMHRSTCIRRTKFLLSGVAQGTMVFNIVTLQAGKNACRQVPETSHGA